MDTLILGILAIASPIMVIAITRSFDARAKKVEREEKLADREADYKRQDAVADKVATAARQTGVAADLLVASNAEVAGAAKKAAGITNARLDALADGQKQIHELVNSNLTASMQDAHDQTALLLAALEENIADKQARGEQPNPATTLQVATAKSKIAEMEAQLQDRAKVQELVDEQQEENPATA